MKKRGLIFIMIFIFCIVSMIIIISFKLNNANFTYNDFEKTTLKEAFNKNDEYFIYLYKEECPFCEKLQETISKLNKSNKIYIINTAEETDNYKKFDWSSYLTENDKEIGTIDNEGNIKYYNNESESKYININQKNKYGNRMRYDILIADSDYLKVNKKAKIDKIYATRLDPEIDYSKYKSDELLTIAGVPTLFHIKDRKIIGFYFDVEDIKNYVETKSN